jgi:hypothetical protein
LAASRQRPVQSLSWSRADDTVRAGPDAQRLIDLTTACSDADHDPLTYTPADDQSAEYGTLSTGDPTLGEGPR